DHAGKNDKSPNSASPRPKPSPDEGTTSNATEETQPIPDSDIDLSVRRKEPKEDHVDAGGETIPLLIDAFMAWSTTPGFISYRNTKAGTWFIQAVVYVFSRFAYKHDLTRLMTKVTNLVAKGEVERTGYKQVCEYKPTMGKTFFFFPKLYKKS
ncbi:hypothetical protein EGW08_005792, partial [Elysia chlorotica]